MSNIHKRYLLLAHSLAKKKFGETFPNPSVGCILVKNNKILAKSSTGKNGRPHAEELVLKIAGKKSLNATMYVTLEPCFHNSGHGSCAEQIVNSGIKSIYIAKIDPDKRTNLKSIKYFKRKLVKTNIGITEENTNKLNYFFFKSLKLKRPYIKVKMAVSKDFMIGRNDCSKMWISNIKSRSYSHTLRSKSQAILTTVKTIISDNPRMNIRQKNKKNKNIPIIVIDKDLKIPINCNIVKSALYRKIIIFSSKKNYKYNKLKNLGCDIYCVKKNKDNQFSLKMIMKKIYTLNINNILVEAGGLFFTNLIKFKMIDELHLFTAPFKIGTKGIPMMYKYKISDLKLKEIKKFFFGKDLYQFFCDNI